MMLFRADLDDTYKAINFYHEALKMQRSLLGEDDPHVIMTLQNASTGYVRAGKYITGLEIENCLRAVVNMDVCII